MTNEKFDSAHLKAQGLTTTSYQAGTKIFSSGEAGDCMYVVESGAVEIATFGTVLDTIGPNDILGEMALIDGAARSATATATQPSTVIAIDKVTFRNLTRDNPDFALEIMGRLVERLRRMNHAQIYFK